MKGIPSSAVCFVTKWISRKSLIINSKFAKMANFHMGLEAKSNLRYHVIDTEKEEAMD